MKKIFSPVLLFLVAATISFAQEFQDVTTPKFRLAVTYGISVMNPEAFNKHIAISNEAFGTTESSVKSMPELGATLSFRPADDNKVVVLRGGYVWTEKKFPFSIKETDTSSISTKTTTGNITETYSAYPLSIGVGLATEKNEAQLHVEFIYALGYVSEEGSFTTSNGQKTSYKRSYFSPAYGFRIAGSIFARLTSNMALNLEVAYRGLTFDQYENESTAQSSPIEFRMSGVQGAVGLAVTF
ncbi:MAG: hypothetical protein PHP42_14270 [Bacteroidota bacterium]|nr:hypothetical protein [Bacteroidota bacterium]